MVKKYIHVNQHKIKANLKHGTNEPVITIKEGRKNTYCHEVVVDPDKLMNEPDPSRLMDYLSKVRRD